jgi:hypothetical protein
LIAQEDITRIDCPLLCVCRVEGGHSRFAPFNDVERQQLVDAQVQGQPKNTTKTYSSHHKKFQVNSRN